jgi:hypothetical protein
MTIVFLIQIVAAVLLLLGSGLIFKALAEIDAPVPPRPIIRHRLDRPAKLPLPQRTGARARLPRAA